MLKKWLQRLRDRDNKNDDAPRKLEPYLADGSASALLRLILENPGITATSLAGRAQLDTDSVGAFLKRMTDDGLIVAEKEAGQPGYHIAGDAKAAVAERLPLNYQCPGMLRER